MGNNPREMLLQRARFESEPSLFNEDQLATDWQREWQGMPEYRMGNTEPVQKITVSFASFEDVQRFCEKLGIRASNRTDSIWFPGDREYLAPAHMRWINEA